MNMCIQFLQQPDDLSRDDPGSTVSGTSRSAKSTRLTSSTVPKSTRASVKKGILNKMQDIACGRAFMSCCMIVSAKAIVQRVKYMHVGRHCIEHACP